MIALIQRVSEASIDIGCTTVASIGRGLVIFLAVESGDNSTQSDTEYSRMRMASST